MFRASLHQEAAGSVLSVTPAAPSGYPAAEVAAAMAVAAALGVVALSWRRQCQVSITRVIVANLINFPRSVAELPAPRESGRLSETHYCFPRLQRQPAEFSRVFQNLSANVSASATSVTIATSRHQPTRRTNASRRSQNGFIFLCLNV
ncbi:hypothetical protein E2C01_083397 [Portunus trituberculatus]|uniref:Uncharacterized protein n=1 Tax=Portunus trituberculatus TaxID=210409 RepID=A0A5B7ISC2_PORTR|nr:hypothetical protein [Portunus trituberculatus]